MDQPTIDALLAVVIVAMLLDVATTLVALRLGARESNWRVRAFMSVFGPRAGIVVTHSLLIGTLILLHPNLNALVLFILAVFFVRAAVKNGLVIQQLSHGTTRA